MLTARPAAGHAWHVGGITGRRTCLPSYTVQNEYHYMQREVRLRENKTESARVRDSKLFVRD